jgi:hypothetical protein
MATTAMIAAPSTGGPIAAHRTATARPKQRGGVEQVVAKAVQIGHKNGLRPLTERGRRRFAGLGTVYGEVDADIVAADLGER